MTDTWAETLVSLQNKSELLQVEDSKQSINFILVNFKIHHS